MFGTKSKNGEGFNFKIGEIIFSVEKNIKMACKGRYTLWCNNITRKKLL